MASVLYTWSMIRSRSSSCSIAARKRWSRKISRSSGSSASKLNAQCGGAGGERVRFGGFGGGGELLEKSNNGASRFSLGFGGVTLHYVIRPGVESVALPHAGNPYPNGRVRFTV